jgi:phosphoglycerol transferase MdoB-like AlkP superfamily enzyme
MLTPSIRGASWKHGGQIYSIYYAALEEKINSNKIDSHVIQDSAFNLKPFKPSKTPNVYLIVLESFRPIHSLDAEIVERIAEKVDINRLVRFNYEGVSPVFGGMSAAAEFELLCGVPELNVLGTLTFNYLGGVNAGLCLPAILENLGYSTVAVTGTKPHFHNASSAYTALGFSTFYSKQHIETSDYDGIHPSDNSIYKTILRIMGNQHGPMLYYLFTAAGHSPYSLNEVSRPPIVNGLNESRYVNRLLYSHLELSSFIELIREQQPDSLFIVVGDHNTVSGRAISAAARIHPMRVPVYISSGNTEHEVTVIPYFNIPRLEPDCFFETGR